MNDILTKIMNECPGMCCYQKGHKLIHLIKTRNIKLSVEIGVYGGRALFSMALGHKTFTDGVAIGIDPWKLEDAMQEGLDDINRRVLSGDLKVDFEHLFELTQKHLIDYGLENHCKLIRAKSADVVNDIPNDIELLHIDGNHGLNAVMNDVRNYLPKVKSGGLIWFDDACWDSIKPAIDLAKQSCKVFDTSHYHVPGDNLILEKL